MYSDFKQDPRQWVVLFWFPSTYSILARTDFMNTPISEIIGSTWLLPVWFHGCQLRTWVKATVRPVVQAVVFLLKACHSASGAPNSLWGHHWPSDWPYCNDLFLGVQTLHTHTYISIYIYSIYIYCIHTYIYMYVCMLPPPSWDPPWCRADPSNAFDIVVKYFLWKEFPSR